MPAGRTINVLYFIAYPHRMAGANRSLFELVSHLPQRVRPLVVLTAEGPVARAYRDAGIPCTVLQAPDSLNSFGGKLRQASRYRKIRTLFRDLLPYALRIRRLILDRDMDLVHVNDARGAAIVAPAARLSRRRMVAHLRGEFSLGNIPRMLFERSADRIIAVSDGAKITLSPGGQQKAVTVYNGIGRIPPPERRLGWLAALRERGVTIICCFASIVPFKGHHHLIEAVARLNTRLRDRVVIVCVGDLVAGYEQYHAWLAALAAVLKVDNVTFAGWHEDPFTFYAHADIAVLPSVSAEHLEFGVHRLDIRGNEGFPRTNLEAMRFGLPVVSTRIAGVPEQVADGVTGVLVEPGDSRALAHALEQLVTDRPSARAMGEHGRDRVARMFSTEAYVDGVLKVYEGLLGSGSGT